MTAKTVVAGLPSSSASIWHYTLFHMSSAPLLLENTQAKALIIAFIPPPETTLHAQLPCPACCPGVAGHVHFEHTSFLSLSVIMPCFPGCSLSLSLGGSISFPSSNFLPGFHWTLSLFSVSFSSPFYFWVNRSPAAIPTLRHSGLTL